MNLIAGNGEHLCHRADYEKAKLLQMENACRTKKRAGIQIGYRLKVLKTLFGQGSR